VPRTKFDSDVKWCLVVAAQVVDGRDGLSEFVDVLEVDREETIAASRSSHWLDVAGERCRPHRYARTLHGPRQELNVIDEVVPAAMVDRLAGPGSQKDLERLVEHLPPQSIIDLVSRP
jgi:hypothetical protein